MALVVHMNECFLQMRYNHLPPFILEEVTFELYD